MYYGARYYDAALGRFISADTIVPNPYNPQALNRYSYVYNNPLRYKDPSGKAPWDVVDIIFWAWSVKDFIQQPSWENAGWLTLDTLSLAPIMPSAGWIRRAGQVLSKGDNVLDATKIARLGNKAEDFLKIGHIRGADTLLDKLLHASDMVRKGAGFELEYATRNADKIMEIGKVLDVIRGGKKEIDFVLEGNIFVNVKDYNWSKYDEFLLRMEIDNLVKQAKGFLEYNPAELRYVFKDSVPDTVREALERIGVIVEVMQ